MTMDVPEWLASADGPRTLIETFGTQSLYALAVALLIALALAVTRTRDPVLRIGLWSLVLLRLVLPVDLASPVSLRSLGDAAVAGMAVPTLPVTTAVVRPAAELTSLQALRHKAAYASPPTAVAAMSMPVVDDLPPVLAPATKKTGSNAQAVPRRDIPPTARRATPHWLAWPIAILAVWTVGVIALVLQYAGQWHRYYALARGARVVKQGQLQEVLEYWRRAVGVRRPVKLVVGKTLLSPFTMGLIKPVIYVPEALTQHDRAHALDAAIGHEMAHVKRLDDLWIKIETLIKIAYFFLPVVWIAGARIEAAREELCDAMALRCGQRQPRRYAKGLISALQLTETRRAASPVPALNRAFVNMRARLTQLHNGGRNIWSDVRAMAAVLVVAGCALPMAQASDQASKEKSVGDAFSAAEESSLADASNVNAWDRGFNAKMAAFDTAMAELDQMDGFPEGFDSSFEFDFDFNFDFDGDDLASAMAEHTATMAETRAAMADLRKSQLEAWQSAREASDQSRDEVLRAQRQAREAKREAQQALREARNEIRQAVRVSQSEALQTAMEALAGVELAIAEIDWSALDALNAGLAKDGENEIDIGQVLIDAGVLDLRERISTAMESSHRAAMEDISRALADIENRAKQGH